MHQTGRNRHRGKRLAAVFGATLLLAGLALGALVWKPWRPSPAPPPVSDRPAGKWHKLRADPKAPAGKVTAAMKRKMAQLESLSYLAGYKPAPAKRGVTVHNKAATSPGYNLVFSGHAPEAALLDIKGSVLHTWRCTYARARARFPALRKPPKGDPFSFRRGHLYDNGDLLAIYEGFGLIKLDRDSKLLWALPRSAHHDLHVERDGKIRVLTRRARLLPRLSADKPVLVDYITLLSPDGKVVRDLALLEAFERSAFSGALSKMPKQGDIFHTNGIEVLDGHGADHSPVFAPGNIMISVLRLDTIAVVDPLQRKVVWALSAGWKRQHEPQMLPNGRVLLFDNLGGAGGRSRVLEIDPLTKQVHWEFSGTRDNAFHSAECGAAYRLPNGNTLIVESLNGRAFEVTRHKKIVWEFYNPHRAGKKKQLIATLFDVVRLPLDFSLEWMKK